MLSNAQPSYWLCTVAIRSFVRVMTLTSALIIVSYMLPGFGLFLGLNAKTDFPNHNLDFNSVDYTVTTTLIKLININKYIILVFMIV